MFTLGVQVVLLTLVCPYNEFVESLELSLLRRLGLEDGKIESVNLVT